MTDFIIYELKFAVILTAFHLCFRLLLCREKLNRLNRIVLIVSAVLSSVLPFCIITLHKRAAASGSEAAWNNIYVNPDAVLTISENGGEGLPWEIIAGIVYWAGVIAVFARMLAGIHRVMKLIQSSEIKNLNGTEVLVCKEETAPFSWMKWIVMCRSDFESGNNHILEHEKAHIRFGHSKDVLLIDILSAFQWFNPSIWLMKRDLRAIHEYEADDAVLKTGANIKEYQYSLIRKAVSASGYSITNSFNHSILKNRITMMSISKKSAMRGLRALYILPLVCGTMALNAKTVVDYESSEIISVRQSPTKFDIKTENGKAARYVGYKESMHFHQIDVKPTFNGGGTEMFSKWIMDNVKYPQEAKAAGIHGRVIVQFTINESGKVTYTKILKGVHPALDAEAKRVVSSSPDWTPGISDGKKVPVTFVVPVFFRAKGESK